MTETTTQINSITKLSDETLKEIQNEIETALIKRGFNVPITLVQSINRDGYLRIELSSEDFQTQPVIFRALRLQHFGGSVRATQEAVNIFNIWLPVNVFWESFSGGSNGTELFTFHCQIKKDREGIFGVVIR